MTHAGQRGFTIAEVLVAAVLITVALVALAKIVPISSYGVQDGNQLSTATLLADQKLEQIKNLPWISSPTNDCLGASSPLTTAPKVPSGAKCKLGANPQIDAGNPLPWLADESAITGVPGYSRTVRITDCSSGGVCGGVTDSAMRLATVTVTYTPMSAGTSSAVTPKSLRLQMTISRR
jgi:prepilin-type N-terminal cleavage/methylation domain-containing protein